MCSLSLFLLALAVSPPAATPAPGVPEPGAAAVPEATYTQTMQQALTDAVAPWLKGELLKVKHLKDSGIVALELHIAADGSAETVRLVVGSGNNAVDDLARRLILAAEPLPPPQAASLGDRTTVSCLTRIDIVAKPPKSVVTTASVCENADATLQLVVGIGDDFVANDAGALFLLGLRDEAKGNPDAAMEKYRQVITAAPRLDWAPRAMGLGLVAKKKGADAITYLRMYVNAHSGSADVANFAREIARYDKLKAAKEADAARVRDRLSNEDFVGGIRKGYALFEPCLKAARDKHMLALGVDTLIFNFHIKHDGTTEGARLEQPGTLLMSDSAECLERAVGSWQFPRYSAGSEIAVGHLPIKVKGSSSVQALATAAGGAGTTASDGAGAKTASEALADEPVFSQCQRTPEELQGFMKSRYGKIQACILAEHRRAPSQKFPDSLPISFVADVDGPVRNVAVVHRAYRDGPMAQCIVEALKGALDPAEGADCPAEFNIDLRALQAPGTLRFH